MEFTADVKDLKKAFSIVCLAVGDSADIITGQALFDVKEGSVFLYTTDNNKMSVAHLPVNNIVSDGNTQFTADPKKIQKLISSSDSDSIKFVYDNDTKTVNVYASEISDAYLSFASMDPVNFLTFDKDLESSTELKTVNAGIFLAGVKFIQGFLPDNDVNKKYASLFIVDGAMKGSNGAHKIGAFKSDDLLGLNISLGRLMLPAVRSLIDFSGATEVTISEADKLIVISSKDQLYKFAFRKATVTAPKLPIDLTAPDSEHIKIECATMVKKLNRLAISSNEEFGIMFKGDDTGLTMETLTDRKSYEKMACVGGPLEFILECNKMKFIIGSFQSTHVEAYIDKTKCTFFSSDTLSIEEAGKEPVLKPYTAVGILTLARLKNPV